MSELRTTSDEESRPSRRRVHLSVDDVFEALINVADSNQAAQGFSEVGGLFANDFFSFLASLHERFEVEIDLYVFAEGEVDGRWRTLADLPDHLLGEFGSAPWLHVGPHAQRYEVKPFEQTLDRQVAMFEGIYRHIDRFAGREARCRWLRLHYFSECYEASSYLSQQGVESLLLTDKPDVAYRLEDSDRKTLERVGRFDRAGLELRRSFCRIETLAQEGWTDTKLEEAFRTRLEEHGYLAIFTHEVDLRREDVKAMTVRCLEVLQRLGATWS